MGTSQKVKDKRISRLSDLIQQGASLPILQKSKVTRIYSTGEKRYTHYSVVSWSEFVEWRTSCVTILEQVVSTKSIHRNTVEKFGLLRNEPEQLQFGLSFLKSIKADLESGFLDDLALQSEPEVTAEELRGGQVAQLVDKKIGILFLAANPKKTTRLRLDEEARTIEERLRTANFRDKFKLNQHWASRVTDLPEAILRYEPHIVHFSGHGNESSGEIVLENETGKTSPVPVKALAELFQILKDSVRCVVLNACFSERQAKAIVAHIDCVVGMSCTIGDQAAIAFAGGFYRALGYGKSIEEAFKLGCNEIGLQKLGEEFTPKLLVRAGVNPAAIHLINRERHSTRIGAPSNPKESAVKQRVSGEGNIAIVQGHGGAITIKTGAKSRKRAPSIPNAPHTIVYYPLLKERLHERINQLAEYRLHDNSRGDRSQASVRGKIFRDINLQFGVEQFSLLKVDDFNKALQWVEEKIRQTRYGRINQKRSRDTEAWQAMRDQSLLFAKQLNWNESQLSEEIHNTCGVTSIDQVTRNRLPLLLAHLKQRIEQK